MDQIPQETLMVDNSVPILVDGKWEWVAEDAPELRRRRSDDDDEDEEKEKEKGKSKTKASPPPTTREDDDNEDATSTITVTPKETDEDGEEEEQSITSTSTASTQSPLPSAFDNNIDYNFTSNGGQSCPRFLNDLLMSDTFKSCYPISMMLQVSHSCPTPITPSQRPSQPTLTPPRPPSPSSTPQKSSRAS
ncbi:hypothetical protein IMZ48_11030 [Candidatus Bathyarchaeota archaeon]|nr:hypothetical protein [Candidatus Bathyarchaeota archaeon]